MCMASAETERDNTSGMNTTQMPHQSRAPDPSVVDGQLHQWIDATEGSAMAVRAVEVEEQAQDVVESTMAITSEVVEMPIFDR